MGKDILLYVSVAVIWLWSAVKIGVTGGLRLLTEREGFEVWCSDLEGLAPLGCVEALDSTELEQRALHTPQSVA